uniref:Uncharacterized protein n=1 Tax=Anguilla anguilla TaxID=7936 RepID=A0A0E9PK44_ANGAN
MLINLIKKSSRLTDFCLNTETLKGYIFPFGFNKITFIINIKKIPDFSRLNY